MLVVAAGCLLAIVYGMALGFAGATSQRRFGATFSNYTTFGYFACMIGSLYILYDSTVAEYRSVR